MKKLEHRPSSEAIFSDKNSGNNLMVLKQAKAAQRKT